VAEAEAKAAEEARLLAETTAAETTAAEEAAAATAVEEAAAAKAAEEALATEDARLAAEAKTAAETVATVAAVAAAAAHPPKVEEAPGGRASVAIGPGVVGNVLSSAEEAASIDAALWALSLKLGGGSAKELLEAILAAMPHRAHPLVGEALTAARARLRELRGN